jgi:hypothetical protein
MAEAADHPAPAADAAAPPPDGLSATAPEGNVRTEAAAPAGTYSGLDRLPGSDAEGYRPLSLLAIIGLGLAVLHAGVILMMATAAFFNRSPFLLSFAWILWPLAALAVCWVARTQIQTSEGTRSGIELTTWGIGLSLGVGLLYWAYYTATVLAVRTQACETAEQWLALIRDSQGDPAAAKLEQAFALTLPPGTLRVDSPEFRSQLENGFNNPPPDAPSPQGAFTSFCQQDYVRFIQEGGPQTRWALQQIEEWSSTGTGYRVRMRYRVQTPAAAFDLVVVADGVWPPGASRRQWYIRLFREKDNPEFATERARDSALTFTELGERLFGSRGWSDDPAAGGRAFLQRWGEALTRRSDSPAPYLGTLPPEQRRRLAEQLARWPFAPGLDGEAIEALRGRDAFLAGGLVQADEATFWPPLTVVDKKEKKDGPGKKIVDEVKQAFAPGSDKIRSFLVFASVPTWEEGERVSIIYAFHLIIGKKIVEGRATVQAERKALEKGDRDAWRVVKLELIRARTMQELTNAGPGVRPLPRP